jgi:hypothetical protein
MKNCVNYNFLNVPILSFQQHYKTNLQDVVIYKNCLLPVGIRLYLDQQHGHFEEPQSSLLLTRRQLELHNSKPINLDVINGRINGFD